ncbi:MAG: hypothetical protein M3040_16880 [Bacteroidota bacterium]|nr:hypothetical protein [Bacteroidota bacterium]
MEQLEFRKLNVNLPREPVTNDGPWFVAGLLLAFVFLLIVAYAFLSYKRYL